VTDQRVNGQSPFHGRFKDVSFFVVSSPISSYNQKRFAYLHCPSAVAASLQWVPLQVYKLPYQMYSEFPLCSSLFLSMQTIMLPQHVVMPGQELASPCSVHL
jgi:hypothetical protein